MIKIRAGSYAASLSSTGRLYIWGEGNFGKFHSPHLMKSAKSLEINDF
jgi:alpha-tubulin suppressor-like RCC1 family protein